MNSTEKGRGMERRVVWNLLNHAYTVALDVCCRAVDQKRHVNP